MVKILVPSEMKDDLVGPTVATYWSPGFKEAPSKNKLTIKVKMSHAKTQEND